MLSGGLGWLLQLTQGRSLCIPASPRPALAHTSITAHINFGHRKSVFVIMNELSTKCALAPVLGSLRAPWSWEKSVGRQFSGNLLTWLEAA